MYKFICSFPVRRNRKIKKKTRPQKGVSSSANTIPKQEFPNYSSLYFSFLFVYPSSSQAIFYYIIEASFISCAIKNNYSFILFSGGYKKGLNRTRERLIRCSAFHANSSIFYTACFRVQSLSAIKSFVAADTVNT